MKKYLTMFILIIYSSCGTTGRIMFYHFNVSKYVVDKQLIDILSKDSLYVVPVKWSNCKDGDVVEMRYVYLKSPPEEIYRMAFKYDSTIWKQTSISSLAFVSQFNGEIWKNERELSKKELERITKRFEEEILSKIKYPYYKSE